MSDGVEAHNERMLEKARELAAANPDATIVIPVYASKESLELAELPEARR